VELSVPRTDYHSTLTSIRVARHTVPSLLVPTHSQRAPPPLQATSNKENETLHVMVCNQDSHGGTSHQDAGKAGEQEWEGGNGGMGVAMEVDRLLYMCDCADGAGAICQL